MAPIYDSLARANGRGSAGECPALHSAKTPFSLVAVRELASRVAAGVKARANAPALTHPADGTAQLIQQLAELRDAARRDYVRSDLTSITPEGIEAADQLAQLLGYPEQRA